MNENIFRKNAIERISSPEQLNDYIKNTRLGPWLVIAALVAFMAGCCVWLFSGAIPDTVQAAGILQAGEISVELTFDEGVEIKEGMQVQISPTYAPRDQYGYLYGTVSDVQVRQSKIAVRVSVGEPRWSSEKGKSVELIDGAPCNLTIVKKVRKPYELVV